MSNDGKRANLVGQKFNRLLIISPINPCGWLCLCDCGNPTTVKDSYEIRAGFKKSCGCLNREKLAAALQFASDIGWTFRLVDREEDLTLTEFKGEYETTESPV